MKNIQTCSPCPGEQICERNEKDWWPFECAMRAGVVNRTRVTTFGFVLNVLKTTKDYKHYSHGTQRKGVSH